MFRLTIVKNVALQFKGERHIDWLIEWIVWLKYGWVVVCTILRERIIIWTHGSDWWLACAMKESYTSGGWHTYSPVVQTSSKNWDNEKAGNFFFTAWGNSFFFFLCPGRVCFSERQEQRAVLDPEYVSFISGLVDDIASFSRNYISYYRSTFCYSRSTTNDESSQVS